MTNSQIYSMLQRDQMNYYDEQEDWRLQSQPENTAEEVPMTKSQFITWGFHRLRWSNTETSNGVYYTLHSSTIESKVEVKSILLG